MGSMSGHDLLSWSFMVDFQYLLMRLLEAIPPSNWVVKLPCLDNPISNFETHLDRPHLRCYVCDRARRLWGRNTSRGSHLPSKRYPLHNNSRGLCNKFFEFQDVWGLFSNPWTVVVRCFEPPLVNDQPLSRMHLIWSPCCLARRCLFWKKETRIAGLVWLLYNPSFWRYTLYLRMSTTEHPRINHGT